MALMASITTSSTASASSWTAKFDRYQQLLRAVPVGLTEWALHPAACEAEGVRSSDFEFLVSPQAADTICSAQIHVLSYQPLRESWRQRESSYDR